MHKRSIRIYLEGKGIKAVVKDSEKGFEREIITRRAPSIFSTSSDFLTLEFFLRDLALPRVNDGSIDAADAEASSQVKFGSLWCGYRAV